MSDKRLAFIDWCLRQEAKPYVWGAKGPEEFDCSGLVTAGIQAVGGQDWRQTHASSTLFDELEPVVGEPKPGDLAFYGSPDHISHVMVVWGDGRVFGACGGNRHTTSPKLAALIGARVKFKPTADYRSDLRGFRRFPLE